MFEKNVPLWVWLLFGVGFGLSMAFGISCLILWFIFAPSAPELTLVTVESHGVAASQSEVGGQLSYVANGAMAALLEVHNPNSLTLEFNIIQAKFLYRKQSLGISTLSGLEQGGRSRQNFTLSLALDDVSVPPSLISDFRSGSIPLDLLAEVKAKPRFWLKLSSVKKSILCDVYFNPLALKLLRKECEEQ
eukprot:TRINITY_DN7516_c0_g1_i1.p1 TRINITY_DN7516_c0_g1~~TRINITY_DN7516_c0_g1_i1.p1  ORF type:complete len:223 (-),score=32.60 TRINITY_DN7516_c0_g1_i1:148-717(-)